MDYLSTVKVAYPKLTLYAFQVKHNLALKPKQPVENANNVWLKCQQLGKQLGVPRLENLPKLIEEANNQKNSITGEILPERILTFTAIKHKKNLHLSGEANPIEIHDTYALDLTLRYPHPEVQLTDLRGLNPDDCLLPKNINASLGQTLVFFAKPVGKIDNEQAFADACVAGLLSEETVRELKIHCQHQGQLLGSPIFEYNNDADSPEEQCHLLIWLNTHSETTNLEEKGEYYYPLINLLLCRSKIIYARSEAIWCYEQAREAYSDLEKYKQEFKEQKNNPIDLKFDKFNQLLNEIPEISFNYVDYLRDLELHRTTIQTNSKNYRLYLDKLNNVCIKSDNLEFLSNFLELALDTFVEQINTDLAYLTPGQNLFDQMIGTIRGIVEVEQAKRDRSLERTIQVVGIAFGGGAIVSGVVTQHIDKSFGQQINFKSLVHHPLVLSLLWSFLATFVFGLVAWLVTKPKPKRTKGK
ncbi:hypothetical protein SAMD00079811_30710 [Scytonema sp. HK-05]|uniref:hypothetical protein n=1 Tax=Scytonema sp. HK-05 TaxID=1137095 RepID=UPI0009360E50|nr:hypothetical protein [Scytonema sp. HK-05]OKH59163.1 hypothetical protein NIES2130_10095 [Scytonema sp. HK-05]BAY45468.1 hypothetical protein SAMD00079811_30710 [Scytonema sp. HK-05]